MGKKVDCLGTREEVEKKLIFGLSSVLTMERYEKAKEMIADLSDEEIFYMAAQSLNAISDQEITQKEYFRMVKCLQESNGVTVCNSALNNIRACLLSEEENEEILKDINKSTPTDIIKLDYKQDNEIIDLWENGEHKEITIPSDLIWNKTIPLLDCEISVDERERYFEDRDTYGRVLTYRVVIFEDYKERLDNLDDFGNDCVGALILQTNIDTKSVFIPIVVAKGFECIPITKIGWINLAKSERNMLELKISQAEIGKIIVSYLETWYGIQVALLHPTVKEVFENPQKISLRGKRKVSAQKTNKKIKYIKRHIVNTDELEEAIYGGGRRKERKRRALIWYVTGHWRKYKDGRKVFVHGYFKGALRDTKKPDAEREREIVIGERPDGEQEI